MAHSKTTFKKGKPPGPGRPKGSVGGRAQVLLLLDELCANKKNKEKIKDKLQQELDKDAGQFLKTYIFPLMPKDVKIDGDVRNFKTFDDWMKYEEKQENRQSE